MNTRAWWVPLLAGTLAVTASSAAVQGTARAVATFAGACFRCREAPVDALPGVVSTTVWRYRRPGEASDYAPESYHHERYRKNPLRYQFCRHACSRDQRIAEPWDPED